MEVVRGTRLSDIWLDLEERQGISVLRQLTQFESKMMSISFLAGGSPYYVQDLKRLARGLGIPPEDEHSASVQMQEVWKEITARR